MFKAQRNYRSEKMFKAQRNYRSEKHGARYNAICNKTKKIMARAMRSSLTPKLPSRH